MNKKLGLDSYLRRIFIAATLTLLLCFTSFGQSKVDLEVKVQSASEAIGGEVFSLAVTVTNRGTVTATDVILLQTTRETTKSAVSSAGECSLSKDYSYIPFPFRCMLGDIRPDETKVINFEISIRDFGGEEVRLDNRRAMPALGSFAGTNGSANHTRDNSIGDIEVRAEEVEENYENNRADIVVLLLPSKNIPPRIEVVSPKSGTVFVAPLTKKIQIPLVIKSFDLDGSISKVTVSLSYMPSMRFLEDDGTFKYLIGGRKYTLAEFERLQQEEWEKLV